MNIKEKLKNKIVWVAVISYVIVIFNQFGVDTSNAKVVIDAFLSILVIIGILNNPK